MSSIHLRFVPIFFLLVCDEYQWLRFFTCVSGWMHFLREFLKGNDMIPCEIWCTSALVNFLMTTKSHSPYGLKQFFRPWIIYFIDKLQSKSCCYTNELL